VRSEVTTAESQSSSASFAPLLRLRCSPSEERYLQATIGSLLFFAAITWSAFRAARRPYHYWYGLTGRRVLLLGANGGFSSYSGASFWKTDIEKVGGSASNRGNLLFDYGPDDEGAMRFRANFFGIRDPTGVKALICGTLLQETEKGMAE
jgi:hypothetical protein